MMKPREPEHHASRNFGITLLSLAFVIYAVSLCKDQSNDLYWQLRTGGEMLSSHHIPRDDHFSWTRPGTPWVVHEWLTFAIFAEAYRLAHGYVGVTVVQCILAAALFLTLFRVLLRETSGAPLTAFCLMYVLAETLRYFLQPRPQLFTYLFLAVELGLILQARRDTTSLRRIWLLIPLSALWANLHAGVAVGLGLIGLYALTDCIRWAFAKDPEERRRLGRLSSALAVTTILSALATLINPYGWRIYEDFLSTVNNYAMLNTVSEWATPLFNTEFGETILVTLALFVLGLAWSKESRDPADPILLLILAHEGIQANRNAPMLCLVGTILFARHVQSTVARISTLSFQSPPGDDPIRAAPFRLSSLCPAESEPRIVQALAVFLLCLSYIQGVQTYASAAPTAARGLERMTEGGLWLQSYPEDGIEFIHKEGFPRTWRMKNYYSAGGYLIWRLPEFPVFIDGRADVYFGHLLDDNYVLNGLTYRWNEIMNKYRPDFIVTNSYDPQARLFLSSPDWALVYASWPDFGTINKEACRQNTFIFVRRGDNRDSLIARYRADCPAFRNIALLKPYRSYLAVQ